MDRERVLYKKLSTLATRQKSRNGRGNDQPWFELLRGLAHGRVTDLAVEGRRAAYALDDIESGADPATYFDHATGPDAYTHGIEQASSNRDDALITLVRENTLAAHRKGVLAA